MLVRIVYGSEIWMLVRRLFKILFCHQSIERVVYDRGYIGGWVNFHQFPSRTHRFRDIEENVFSGLGKVKFGCLSVYFNSLARTHPLWHYPPIWRPCLQHGGHISNMAAEVPVMFLAQVPICAVHLRSNWQGRRRRKKAIWLTGENGAGYMHFLSLK